MAKAVYPIQALIQEALEAEVTELLGRVRRHGYGKAAETPGRS